MKLNPKLKNKNKLNQKIIKNYHLQTHTHIYTPAHSTHTYKNQKSPSTPQKNKAPLSANAQTANGGKAAPFLRATKQRNNDEI